MIPQPTTAINRLGLLGGTFDPIHIGHLRIALCAQHQLQLDQVHFLPTPQPPHKENRQITDFQHRLEMVELAIKPHPDFQASTLESTLPSPQYTLNTLVALRNQWGKKCSLYWIMGTDSLTELMNWHEWAKLTDYSHLVVATRPTDNALPRQLTEWLSTKTPHDASAHRSKTDSNGSVIFLKLPPLNLSSTVIQHAVAHDEPLQYLTPKSVIDYIGQNRLYLKG